MSTRRISSGVWLVVLLVAALAAISFLSVQASRNKPAKIAASADSKPSPKPRPSTTKPKVYKVPDDSGTGRRVVYSLSLKRVWLISESESTARTFTVWPGNVPPAVGKYPVAFRRAEGTGSDGVRIEHAVYFGAKSAFSHAVDGASPAPDSTVMTGAIRESVADGKALWDFATKGTFIHVVG
ncbi:hypothetical protein [Streptomyces brevispora]|uniref:L,D-transpeptidase-like protein n=1 Tax=Streptomyces brevispora TaxID=887462 RepID=A0A561UXU4_9ACTN|nr:hypothetical protein [Streptomyces brevispora]TWG04186.1 hypothetical protein FHX80_112630 [Streptomyces brevispora]WSC14753.1 hypothetical protein OIE64_19205 [Streptomyces brevispora]